MNQRLPVIAVVDDEESVRRALGRLLRSAGFEVEAFAGGREFLDASDDWRIDCVILDLHMPPPNGFEVLERLAMRKAQPLAIVLTGHDSPMSRARATASGRVSQFLAKPIDGDVLLQAIHDVTASRQCGRAPSREIKP